jgi:transposase InsO family protein
MIEESDLPIKLACKTLGLSRSSYYKGMPSGETKDDPKIEKMIEKIILEFVGYGYRRVTKELHRKGKRINSKKVLRIMQEGNLVHKKRKFRLVTTDSKHNLPVYPNLAKGLKVTKLNQLWVADITYVLLPGGHVYLAVIIDVYSRKCIGWDLGGDIDTDLVLNALEMAIRKRKYLGFDGLIHHSDQGVQYASHEYVRVLRNIGAKISMSRKGNPYDNAFVESFMKTLKAEEVYVNEYLTFEDAYKNIKHFIEVVYNKKRLHSSIGYKPPIEFEKEVLNSS